jgi:hypothetical protein
MKEIIVAVLKYGSKILILKRNKNKRFDPSRWEFVSSFVKENDLETFTIKQVLYETGLNAKLIKKGESFEVNDEYGKWLIHPFLLETDGDKVILKEDHVEYKWINSKELVSYKTVKDLDKNLESIKLNIS